MKQTIETQRLLLRALTFHQLRLCLDDVAALERELDLKIARDLFDGNVLRALNMKLEKMKNSDPAVHPWQTYWLVIVQQEMAGAGMAGFKGTPDAQGYVEIGYGISPDYQGRGLMSEAVRALVDWALEQPGCNGVTASKVTHPASRRLLEKLGAQRIVSDGISSSWKFTRKV